MVTIRKAVPQDAEAIAMYLFIAMEEIVYRFIGRKAPQEAIAFLLHFVRQENNQYSWQNCWVADNGAGVVAAANLYDGARLQELRQPVLTHIKNYFQDHFVPEDETGPGEYYIDTLGVHPIEQGKGIGSKMLDFLIEEYVKKREQTIGLLVEEENNKAKRLYQKAGFKPAGTKLLFGKKMEHLQIRRRTIKGAAGTLE